VLVRSESQANDPTVPLTDLLRSPRRALWVGALSFEERCTASPIALAKLGLRIAHGVLLDYSTSVYPAEEAKARRAANHDTITGLEGSVWEDAVETFPIPAYSFQKLLDALDQLVERYRAEVLLCDITCMTILHTLALAAKVNRIRDHMHWGIAYTRPENYGELVDGRTGRGWRDIIVAPLAEAGQLFNEAHSRGVIICGHEADRLVVGLTEIEPSGGVIMVGNTPKRPDLARLAERLNRKVINGLTQLRSAEWRQRAIDVMNMAGAHQEVAQEVELARRYSAPILFFPYGPKPMTFSVALQLCRDYAEATWFVCPIPSGYDVNYSEGVEETVWLIDAQFDFASELGLSGGP
jgi:hypothetical protein